MKQAALTMGGKGQGTKESLYRRERRPMGTESVLEFIFIIILIIREKKKVGQGRRTLFKEANSDHSGMELEEACGKAHDCARQTVCVTRALRLKAYTKYIRLRVQRVNAGLVEATGSPRRVRDCK